MFDDDTRRKKYYLFFKSFEKKVGGAGADKSMKIPNVWRKL
jgi:hypothetical protein